MLLLPAPAFATRMFAVTNDSPPQDLISFDSAGPATLSSNVAITGLGAGDTIVGLDLRPANDELYVLTTNASVDRLYELDPYTAVASDPVTLAADPADSSNPFTSLAGTTFGGSFDPVTDQLRVVTNLGENVRVNPDTGLVTTDTNITAGKDLDAVAFSDNFQGATTTAEYGYDFTTDELVVVDPPESGTVINVGSSGLVTVQPGNSGLDITPGGTAFMNAVVGATNSLYQMNLSTGAATLVGTIGTGSTAIVDIASMLENVVSFSQATLTQSESGGTADLTVTRANADGQTTVHYSTADGTATGGADYVPTADGTVTFAPGEISKTISIPIINDTNPEPSETFTVSLTGASTQGGTAAIISPRTVTVTIDDDDPSTMTVTTPPTTITVTTPPSVITVTRPVTDADFLKSGLESLKGADVGARGKLIPKADGSLALLDLDCRSTTACGATYRLFLGKPSTKRKPTLVGAKGTVSIPAGDSRSRVITLSQTAIKMLRKHKKIISTLIVVASDRSGHARTVTLTLTLTAPKRR